MVLMASSLNYSTETSQMWFRAPSTPVSAECLQNSAVPAGANLWTSHQFPESVIPPQTTSQFTSNNLPEGARTIGPVVRWILYSFQPLKCNLLVMQWVIFFFLFKKFLLHFVPMFRYLAPLLYNFFFNFWFSVVGCSSRSTEQNFTVVMYQENSNNL